MRRPVRALANFLRPQTSTGGYLTYCLKLFATGCLLVTILSLFHEGFLGEAVRTPPKEATWAASDFYRKYTDANNTARRVDIGVYIDSLFDLNLVNSTYKARGWIWHQWKPECMTSCEKSNPAQPDEYGSFDLNYVSDDANRQSKSYRQTAIPWTETGAEKGVYWNEVEFSGTLYTHLNLRKFPFDTQALQIRITSPEYEADHTRFYFKEFEVPSSQVIIPGYVLAGTKTIETVRQYTSKFGFQGDQYNTAQSQLIGEVMIRRSTWASLMRYFFPVTIVAGLTLLTLGLKIEYWEVKLASPATAILSLLFLQDGFKSGLPITAYLTVIDFYCIMVYIVLFLVFLDACLLIIERNNKSTNASDDQATAASHHLTKAGTASIVLFALSPLASYLYYKMA